MAKKKQAAAAGDGAPAAEERGRSKLVLGAVAAVVLAGGGYVYLSGPGAAAEDPATAAAAAAAAAPVPGEVVALDPVTLNLADGRFLKVGLALQLVEGAATVDAAGVPGFAAPALDEAISVLGGRTYAELVAPGGRDGVKQALSERVAARYEGDVAWVYFTEFVMQ